MAIGRKELCDLQLDLQHDPGKYLRQLPAYLPGAASPLDGRPRFAREWVGR